MIDFEQEIEDRLQHFQHLTGKGNVKDGNRTLYEILRLMLGMIHQNGIKTASGSLLQPVMPVDASSAWDETINAQAALLEPSDVPPSDVPPSDIAMITPVALQHPTQACLNAATTVCKPLAPYGYTRAGHVRLTPPSAPYGYTETGLPRKTPLKGKSL